MSNLRVLLNAGGSGGHIYPLLSVIEALNRQAKENDLNIMMRFYGASGEYELSIKNAGIPVYRVASSKFRRYFSILNFIDAIKFIWSIPQALWKIFWFMPDVAFSKGGPGSLAVLYACRFYRIPIIIHESDAIPSLTTNLISKNARLVELSFESAKSYIQNTRIKVVGNPIREDLVFNDEEINENQQKSAKRKLNFDDSLPLILVLGGSQGALLINKLILEIIPELTKTNQILHVTGVGHFSAFMMAYNKSNSKNKDFIENRYRPVPFLGQDLRAALIASDLIISRAGAGSIFEIASAGKPSILIPLQNSANDHQSENAFQYRANNACEIISEENLSTDLVGAIIKNLLQDGDKLHKMSENAKNFSKPDAAKNIAKDIITIANG